MLSPVKYLMLDVVINHFGWAGAENTVNYAEFNPFNQQSFFHSYCPITDYDYSSNQTAVEDVRVSLTTESRVFMRCS